MLNSSRSTLAGILTIYFMLHVVHVLFSEAEESYDFSWLFGEEKEEVDIKVMVPNGMIFGVGKDDEIVWQHKVQCTSICSYCCELIFSDYILTI